jgi:hypothetical protein
VLFFGFIDTANPFTSITFGDTAPGVDFFGFDDMTIGTVAGNQGSRIKDWQWLAWLHCGTNLGCYPIECDWNCWRTANFPPPAQRRALRELCLKSSQIRSARWIVFDCRAADHRKGKAAGSSKQPAASLVQGTIREERLGHPMECAGQFWFDWWKHTIGLADDWLIGQNPTRNTPTAYDTDPSLNTAESLPPAYSTMSCNAHALQLTARCDWISLTMKKSGGIMRDFFREFNRVMTRGHIVIRTRQQPDSTRERIRAQVIIAIFLIAIFITCVVSILEVLKR